MSASASSGDDSVGNVRQTTVSSSGDVMLDALSDHTPSTYSPYPTARTTWLLGVLSYVL